MDAAPPILCIRCGYDLRGTVDDQPCPECGLLAARSLRLTDALRGSRPNWLRGLSIGTRLLLLSFILVFFRGWLGESLWDIAYDPWPPTQGPTYWSFARGPLVPAAPVGFNVLP